MANILECRVNTTFRLLGTRTTMNIRNFFVFCGNKFRYFCYTYRTKVVIHFKLISLMNNNPKIEINVSENQTIDIHDGFLSHAPTSCPTVPPPPLLFISTMIYNKHAK